MSSSTSLATPDPGAIGYLARRAVSPQWRGFLRALMDTLDANLDVEGRDALLRAIGARLAAVTPLPACATLHELESRANEALAGMEWGYTGYFLDLEGRSLEVRHQMAPRIATDRDAAGGWLALVLEGLHAGWLGAQAAPATAPRLRCAGTEAGCITLRSVA